MLSTETIITRLLISVLLGGIIGVEREYRNKAAGFRTLTLISLGSCLFTVVSEMITNDTSDRIASNIVTGIGFIGAGVIFKETNRVNGLTTAASIWVTAAIGMAVGAGYYIASSVCSVLVVVVLAFFTWIEDAVDLMNQEREYRIVTIYEPEILDKYEKKMREYHLKYKIDKRTRMNEEITASWKVHGSQKNHDLFIAAMLKEFSVKQFDF